MTLTLDEVFTHDKAIRAVARQLRRNEWALASTYAALQGHAIMQDNISVTLLAARMEKQGYEQCVSHWTLRDREVGLPLLSPSPGRLVFLRSTTVGSLATPVLLARYVYYRTLEIGVPPLVKLFIVLGPRWRELPVRTAAIHGLTARQVGSIQPIAGMLSGRKYNSMRMDWI